MVSRRDNGVGSRLERIKRARIKFLEPESPVGGPPTPWAAPRFMESSRRNDEYSRINQSQHVQIAHYLELTVVEMGDLLAWLGLDLAKCAKGRE